MEFDDIVRRSLVCLKKPGDRRAFEAFLEAAWAAAAIDTPDDGGIFCTVAGVTVEFRRILLRREREAQKAQKLQGGEGGAVKWDRFWSVAWEELRRWGITEVPIALEALDPSDLCELGPVDAAVLHLAEREGRTVVTAENGLRKRCIERAMPCLQVFDIIEQQRTPP